MKPLVEFIPRGLYAYDESARDGGFHQFCTFTELQGQIDATGRLSVALEDISPGGLRRPNGLVRGRPSVDGGTRHTVLAPTRVLHIPSCPHCRRRIDHKIPREAAGKFDPDLYGDSSEDDECNPTMCGKCKTLCCQKCLSKCTKIPHSFLQRKQRVTCSLAMPSRSRFRRNEIVSMPVCPECAKVDLLACAYEDCGLINCIVVEVVQQRSCTAANLYSSEVVQQRSCTAAQLYSSEVVQQ